jgi:O-antigen ligase
MKQNSLAASATSMKHGDSSARTSGLLRSLPIARREAPRIFPNVGDLFSIETSFILFLFAGRYKTLPELQWFPIDFTLLFFAITAASMACAIISGKIQRIPLDLPVMLMILLGEIAALSLFWSSLGPPNFDKLWRFLLLTVTAFVAARVLAEDRLRRERLIRMAIWLSCAILAYYEYYRWVVGIDVARGGWDAGAGAPTGRPGDVENNYLEYAAHAGILFVVFLCLAIFGSPKVLGIAVVGSVAMLFALASIGGRGPLTLAFLAIPLLALGLGIRGGGQQVRRLLVFLSALIATAVLGYIAIVRFQGEDAAWEQMHTLQRYQTQLVGESTDSVDERLEAQRFAFEQWQKKPILGWGIGEFRVQRVIPGYPHNLLLESLMELGLTGAVLLFSACAIAVLNCIRWAWWGTIGWVDASIVLLFLTELVSHLTVQGYLADDRIFFTYMALAIALRPAASPREVWRVHYY